MNIFEIFFANRDFDAAVPMAKYMRNKFYFLGIKKPKREALSKEFLKKKKKDKEVDWKFIHTCFDLPDREFQYLGIDYMVVVKDLFIPEDMDKVPKIITTKSWWDSVDAINKVVGHIAMKYPEIKDNTISNWIESDNIWLKRVSIIFQLRYKENTDTEFLSKAILHNAKTDAFFINNAIGWALREYSKTNREWVKKFIETNELSKLSVREGSKYI